jgi:uroporphyrinogen-III synthase
MLVKKQLDILLFTSPSTVDHFMETVSRYKLDNLLKDCIFGCIGPSTEKKLRAYGLPVHASPKEYTVKEMVKSTIAYLEMEEL